MRSVIFAKKVTREKKIPFEVSADSFYDENNIRYLEKIMEDVKNGKASFAEHELIEEEKCGCYCRDNCQRKQKKTCRELQKWYR